MSNPKPYGRQQARASALQAIYQWQYTQETLSEIELQFHEDKDFSKIDADYFRELIYQVPKQIDKIDEQITKVLDRPFEDINPVELAVMRIAVYELLFRPDVPYKVVINEALRNAKTYGAQEGFKYVNGVLDTLAKEIRSFEVQNHQKKRSNEGE